MKSGEETSAMKGAASWLRVASVVTLLLAAATCAVAWWRLPVASRECDRRSPAAAG